MRGLRLFSPRRVPSFSAIAGSEAAAAYRRDRESQIAQELANRRQARLAKNMGQSIVENGQVAQDAIGLDRLLPSLIETHDSIPEDLHAPLDK